MELDIRRKLLLLTGLIGGLVLIGTIGFHFLEHWSWLDSAYAAVITLGTVGYGDFVPTQAAEISPGCIRLRRDPSEAPRRTGFLDREEARLARPVVNAPLLIAAGWIVSFAITALVWAGGR